MPGPEQGAIEHGEMSTDADHPLLRPTISGNIRRPAQDDVQDFVGRTDIQFGLPRRPGRNGRRGVVRPAPADVLDQFGGDGTQLAGVCGQSGQHFRVSLHIGEIAGSGIEIQFHAKQARKISP